MEKKITVDICDQEGLVNKTFGATRFVYNDVIDHGRKKFLPKTSKEFAENLFKESAISSDLKWLNSCWGDYIRKAIDQAYADVEKEKYKFRLKKDDHQFATWDSTNVVILSNNEIELRLTNKSDPIKLKTSDDISFLKDNKFELKFERTGSNYDIIIKYDEKKGE